MERGEGRKATGFMFCHLGIPVRLCFTFTACWR